MRKIFCLCFSLFFVTGVIAENKDVQTMHSMVKRLFPKYASSFNFVINKKGSKDCFELKSVKNKIVISGNDANSLAVGLNYYLKNYCLTTVSWFKDEPVEMPNVLPRVPSPVISTSKVPVRFFLNYCTFGYTMVWWKWSDWERFIDWMALNGINMPLAITGQEAIWYNIWHKFGLTDEEIRSYFTGPAFLPWHRMCNIDGWQGPLPMNWILSQEELQKLIVKREREFNMRPVLPAFSGHIPSALKLIYPDIKSSKVSQWGNFESKYNCTFLDPGDSLYSVIQREYLKEQTRLYGTDHIYGVDPFNEVSPPSWDEKTLKAYSKHIYESLSAVDPQAIWLQMGWLFYNDSEHWTTSRIDSYLNGVPKGKLILLDYFCDNVEVWKKTNGFFGQPYIWCYLGNFGGNTMLAGNVKLVSKRLKDVYYSGGSNFKGIGSTLEGFDVNEFMYEFVFSKAWNIKQTDEIWFRRLADSRMGYASAEVRKAWKMLADNIYIQPTICTQATLTNARPCLKSCGGWTTNDTITYSQKDLLEVWRLLLSADKCKRESYEFDVVNIGRQVLGNYFRTVRDDFTDAYEAHDINKLKEYGNKMKNILSDMDKLLSCNSTFSLKKWITDARDMGQNKEEKDYYETDARTLITRWGDSPSLTDYANRSWAELTDQYYAVRWCRFIDEVTKAAEEGKTFDEKKFYEWSTTYESRWADPANTIEYHEGGNGVFVANRLYKKYANEITENNKIN